MAYKIQYGQTMIKTDISAKERNSGKNIRSLLLCVVVAVVAVVLLSKSKKLESFIYPGNAQITKEALSDFTDDVRDGGDLKDALLVFCQEIINNANVS